MWNWDTEWISFGRAISNPLFFGVEFTQMFRAELSEKRRLKLIEEKITDCFEERFEIINALSKPFESDTRMRYKHRMDELGYELAVLWCEYRKLARTSDVSLDSNLF